MIVAWRVLWLTYEARKNPEKRIDEVLDEQEWQVLYLATQKKKALPTFCPTLREGVRQIASQMADFSEEKGMESQESRLCGEVGRDYKIWSTDGS